LAKWKLKSSRDRSEWRYKFKDHKEERLNILNHSYRPMCMHNPFIFIENLNKKNTMQIHKLIYVICHHSWLQNLRKNVNIVEKNKGLPPLERFHNTLLWSIDRPNIMLVFVHPMLFRSFSNVKKTCHYNYKVPPSNSSRFWQPPSSTYAYTQHLYSD
jgi:hypothetical protein